MKDFLRWLFSNSNFYSEILTAVQVARERSHLKLGSLSILRDSTTQKIAIKKFIATHDNISVTEKLLIDFYCVFMGVLIVFQTQEIEISSYSLVFWEDQTAITSHLIQKEGYLFYLMKTGVNNSTQEWKRAYFVLK